MTQRHYKTLHEEIFIDINTYEIRRPSDYVPGMCYNANTKCENNASERWRRGIYQATAELEPNRLLHEV